MFELLELLAAIGAFACARWIFRVAAALRENRSGYSGRMASQYGDHENWCPPETGRAKEPALSLSKGEQSCSR